MAQICGTPAHVADFLEHTGCDGFHFRPAQGIANIEYLLEVCMKLIPVLQKCGLVRDEYQGAILQDHLSEF